MTNEKIILKIQEMQAEIKSLQKAVSVESGDSESIKDIIKETVNINFVNNLYRNK